jgi:hypothetical protein
MQNAEYRGESDRMELPMGPPNDRDGIEQLVTAHTS